MVLTYQICTALIEMSFRCNFNIQSAICTNENEKLEVRINNIKVITNSAINRLKF